MRQAAEILKKKGKSKRLSQFEVTLPRDVYDTIRTMTSNMHISTINIVSVKELRSNFIKTQKKKLRISGVKPIQIEERQNLNQIQINQNQG